jgi:hypothetical protein
MENFIQKHLGLNKMHIVKDKEKLKFMKTSEQMDKKKEINHHFGLIM